jgi:hypothetical protein
MLISLKSEVENSHPLQFPSVFLSLPNFVTPGQQLYKDRFILAAELAGLSPFCGRNVLPAHAGMIELYGVYHCPAIEIDDRRSIRDIECKKYNGRQVDTVISIDYGAENLGLMLMPREDGWFMPDLATIVDKLDMGANSSLKAAQPEAYWRLVTDTIDAFCQLSTTPIDLLLLIGDHIMDAQFLAVVQRVFHSNLRIRKEDYLR